MLSDHSDAGDEPEVEDVGAGWLGCLFWFVVVGVVVMLAYGAWVAWVFFQS